MSRRGGTSGLRQLVALLATFVAGLGLVLVTAVVAPGAIRISDHLATDDVSVAALTDASQELAEAAVRSGAADGGTGSGDGAADAAGGGAGDGSDGGSDDDEAGPETEADDDGGDDGDTGGTDDEADDAGTDDGTGPDGEGSGAKDEAESGGGAEAASEAGTEESAGPADDDGSADADTDDGRSASESARVLELVNAERAAAGCGDLRADAALDDLGAAHSQDMADRGYFDHTTPEGLSPWDRADAAGVQGLGAENIARGQPDAEAVVAAWMDSPGHRANILSCDLTRHGLGVQHGAGGPWWTQVFGR